LGSKRAQEHFLLTRQVLDRRVKDNFEKNGDFACITADFGYNTQRTKDDSFFKGIGIADINSKSKIKV